MANAPLYDQVFPALSGKAADYDRRQSTATARLVSQLIRPENLHKSDVGVVVQIGAGRPHRPNLDQTSFVGIGRRRTEHNSVWILLARPAAWGGEHVIGKRRRAALKSALGAYQYRTCQGQVKQNPETKWAGAHFIPVELF